METAKKNGVNPYTLCQQEVRPFRMIDLRTGVRPRTVPGSGNRLRIGDPVHRHLGADGKARFLSGSRDCKVRARADQGAFVAGMKEAKHRGKHCGRPAKEFDVEKAAALRGMKPKAAVQGSKEASRHISQGSRLQNTAFEEGVKPHPEFEALLILDQAELIAGCMATINSLARFSALSFMSLS